MPPYHFWSSKESASHLAPMAHWGGALPESAARIWALKMTLKLNFVNWKDLRTCSATEAGKRGPNGILVLSWLMSLIASAENLSLDVPFLRWPKRFRDFELAPEVDRTSSISVTAWSNFWSKRKEKGLYFDEVLVDFFCFGIVWVFGEKFFNLRLKWKRTLRQNDATCCFCSLYSLSLASISSIDPKFVIVKISEGAKPCNGWVGHVKSNGISLCALMRFYLRTAQIPFSESLTNRFLKRKRIGTNHASQFWERDWGTTLCTKFRRYSVFVSRRKSEVTSLYAWRKQWFSYYFSLPDLKTFLLLNTKFALISLLVLEL